MVVRVGGGTGLIREEHRQTEAGSAAGFWRAGSQTEKRLERGSQGICVC